MALSSEFFRSDEWHAVLSTGVGGSKIVIPDNPTTTFTLFRRGPVQVAIADFPIGVFEPQIEAELHRRECQLALRDRGVWMLRYVSHGSSHVSYPGDVLLPNTVIADLPAWSEDDLHADVRYEIRRARREGVSIRPLTAVDGPTLYDLYSRTVRHHGGLRRYPRPYFEALARLAEHDTRLHARVAETPNQAVCGFIIVANDQCRAFYLHAAIDRSFSAFRPAYALLADAISCARDRGSTRFDLMISPAHQTELIKFKEKWGATTYLCANRTLGLGVRGRTVCACLHVLRAWQ